MGVGTYIKLIRKIVKFSVLSVRLRKMRKYNPTKPRQWFTMSH